MKRKMVFAPLLALVLAIGLFPGMALADDTDISTCEFKFVNKGGDWALYYAKGKTAGVTPKIALYDNGKKLSADKYTVSYKLTWWKGDTQKRKAATAPLKPKSPEGGSAASYEVIVKAKKGSGYTGTFNMDGRYPEATVCDIYGLDNQFADPHLAKCPEKLHFAINPMNPYYYVVPQKKAKAILGSLEVRTGGENSMENPHDGKLVPSKYLKVVYYTGNKNAVEKNMAKKVKKLSKQPTTAGTYVMVVKGTGKYYGSKEILFDIQDKMSNVEVAKIKDVKYTGKTVKPKIKVTYAGTTLKKGKDYQVIYKDAKGKVVEAKNLKKAGTYTAVIKGCNPIKTNVQGKIVTKKQDRYFTGKKSVKFKVAK